MAKNMLGVIFLGLLVAYDAFAAVDGVVSGDVRCVVLQRRSGIDESGPGELGTHYTGAGFLRGFSAGEVLGGYSGDDGLMRESHQKLLPRIVDLHQALPFPPRRKHKIHCGLATVEILTAA
ncbi:hypothetical protein PV325_002128 [Microctonus aethiopoides]|nr:hypothetical protein PV325_002128 [Microctonus aethiopoides]